MEAVSSLAAGAAAVLPDTQQNGLASWQLPLDGSQASHVSAPPRPPRDPSASSQGATPTTTWANMSPAARDGSPVAAGDGLRAYPAPSTAGAAGDAAPPVSLRVLEPHSPGQAEKPRLRVGEGDMLVRSGEACRIYA